jgi:hypothetical protein
MREITLQNPSACGQSISAQFRSCGAELSDSVVKEYWNTVWEEFKGVANQFYSEAGEEYTREGSECGLCGHTIYTECHVKAIKDPFVSNQPELGMVVTWPYEFSVGVDCVKLLGIESYTSRFVKSCFKPNTFPVFTTEDSGLIKTYNIIRKYDDWAFDSIVLPHSVFCKVTADVMVKAGLHVSQLKNVFDPKGKYQKTLRRSFLSKRGKWNESVALYPTDGVCNNNIPSNKLATYLTKDDAARIVEIVESRSK